MRENGPLLSRVVDPPGTNGGPRAGNFPCPPKNTFCPRRSHDLGQKGSTRDKRAFCPGWWLHPGQKAPILYMCAPCSSSPNTSPPSPIRCFSAAASAISDPLLLLRREPRNLAEPPNLDHSPCSGRNLCRTPPHVFPSAATIPRRRWTPCRPDPRPAAPSQVPHELNHGIQEPGGPLQRLLHELRPFAAARHRRRPCCTPLRCISGRPEPPVSTG